MARAGAASRHVRLAAEEVVVRRDRDDPVGFLAQLRVDRDESIGLESDDREALGVCQRVPAEVAGEVPGGSPRDAVAEQPHLQLSQPLMDVECDALAEFAGADGRQQQLECSRAQRVRRHQRVRRIRRALVAREPQERRRVDSEACHVATLSRRADIATRRDLGAARPKGDAGEMAERDDFRDWVQSDLYRAERALHDGDAGPRRALWSQNEPVSVLGAMRNASGSAEVSALFSHLATTFSDCTSYEIELLSYDVVGDMAYTAALEHTSASLDGEPRTYTLRATQVYRREDGEWRVAHRHGDFVGG